MEKGIYKRPHSKYLWISYAGLDGRIIRESSGTEKYQDAKGQLIKRKNAIQDGKQPEVRKIGNHSFNELITEYLKWAERQRCYRSKLGFIKQLSVSFGNMPLRRFNTLLIEQYQAQRTQRGNKPATVNRHIATLKHMFTKAVEWDMVEEEILKRVKRVKLLEENNRRLNYLSKEECQALVNACDSHVRPIVIMALNTGMRKGEILGLKWDNIDLRHGFILLDRTKNGERREVPINGTLRTVLQSLTRRLDIPYVFFDPNTGKAYQNVKRSFQTALKRIGKRDFKFHDLRHTFASQLVMAGVDLTTVKELLGHKTVSMTLRYAHLAPAHKVKAVDILDSTLNESTAHLLHTMTKKEPSEIS